MRQRLSSLPTWVLLVLIWVPWTAVVFVVGLISQVELRWNLGFATVFGLGLAVALTFSVKQRWRLQDEALGDVPEELRRSATRAAWTGPVPTDLETRAAARRVAERHLQQFRRIRPVLIIGLACMIASAVVNAFVDPWRLLFSVFYLPVIGILATTPQRLRKRIIVLSDSATAAEESPAAVPND
jgi:hypothetical protein